MKAYCSFSDFNKDARKLIVDSGIDLTINETNVKPSGDELIKLIEEYDILIIGVFSKFTASMIKYVKKPIIIATLSVGTDHIAREFLDSPLVDVINIRTANAISVAEHIFSLILALNKRVYEGNNLVIDGKGHRSNICERPEDISNKTLGLIGAGNISKEVLKIAKVFNMRVICYTKNPLNHKDFEESSVCFKTLDEVLKGSDIINVSIPLNEETNNLISREKINLLKTTSTFINTSRAEVVDNSALVEYADKYSTFYAGLDIDLDEYTELFNVYRHNIIVTPHLAGISKQAVERMDSELVFRIVDKINKRQ